MTEEQAKEMYLDLMDILAIAAMNQSNEDFDFKDYLNQRGYDI